MRQATVKMPILFSPLPTYESLTLNLTSVLNKIINLHNKVIIVFNSLFTGLNTLAKAMHFSARL